MKQFAAILCLLMAANGAWAWQGPVQNALNAQSSQRTYHTLSLNAGPEWITSRVADDYSGREYRWRTGVEFQAEYDCVFGSGYGFGVVGSYCETSYPSATVKMKYFAPAFVMQSGKNRWNFKWEAGIGAAHYDEDFRAKWGVGYHVSAGAEYLLTKHVGLGADLMTFSSSFGKDETGYYQTEGFSRMSLLLGLRFHL